MNVRGWKPDEERGAFGAWLREAMGDMTSEQLAAEMSARGHHHGADYYRAMASGNKQPGRIIRRALEEYYGRPPEKPAPQPDLAAALVHLAEIQAGQTRALDEQRHAMELQTAALTELIDRVKELAAIQRGQTTALQEMVEDLPTGIAGALGLAPARPEEQRETPVRAARTPEGRGAGR